MSIASEKLEALRAELLSDQRKGGALLVIYPPEEELTFRAGYGDVIQELRSNRIEIESFFGVLFLTWVSGLALI
jgi:hypothetical protein